MVIFIYANVGTTGQADDSVYYRHYIGFVNNVCAHIASSPHLMEKLVLFASILLQQMQQLVVFYCHF